MKKIVNTAKKEVRPDWLMGGNPNAILDQEERGQEQLCASSQLPRKDHFGKDARHIYIKLGIKIEYGVFDRSDDDLFYTVKLPTGWKITPTDHSMWSELKDDKGEVVANIFYKAAFYDRSAFIRLKVD